MPKIKIIIIAILIILAITTGFFAYWRSHQTAEPVVIPFAFQQMSDPTFPNTICNIKDYGAVSDGTTKNSEAFQKAIADCASKGGGKVLVPEGKWLTGAIHLQSNIDLDLAKGATMLFSTDPKDYLPVVFTRWEGIELYNYSPFIYANDAQNIAITGNGTLDGQGEAWMAWKKQEQAAVQKSYDMAKNNVPVEQRIFGTEQAALRPSFVQFINCQNVLLQDFSITNSPMWTIHPLYSENIIVRGINMQTHGHNTDGIVIDSSKNVLIENSTLSTGDDSISIKSGIDYDGWRVGKPSENIVIRNSTLSDGHSGVAIGSEMSGDVRNVIMYGLNIHDVDQGIRVKSIPGRGGVVENIYAQNIVMNKVANAAYQIDLTYDSSTLASASDKMPALRNFYVDGLSATETNYAVSIEGTDADKISSAHFKNMTVQSKKGVAIKHASDIDFKNVKITGLKKPPTYSVNDSTNVSY